MKTSRFISLLLCVVMIMSLFTGLAGAASADDVITHEVQSGEILLKICESHGLNYYTCKNAIMQLNGFTSEAQLARLNVGQKLKLPASNAVAGTVSTTTATVATTTVGGTTMTTTSYGAGVAAGGNVAFYLVPYTVKNGDTLNKICNELGSNYYYYSPVIQGINALANPNQIYAGQVLLIPTASAAGATSAVIGHVVKAGETMSSIANQYGINYQAQRQLINGLNRRDNMDKIYVGQTVLVPGAAAVSTGSVVTTTAAAAPATPATANGTYQISISAADNGSPYAVVNNTQYATRANAGETVNLVPAPKAGYAVRDIQVIRTDSGTDIPVSNYSFTMPNSSVQVTVYYSRGYVINKVASPYGSFDTMIYGTNATTAFFGDEIVLSIYPKTGYNVRLDAGDITGVYYQKSDLSIDKVYVQQDPQDGLYKFKMPNYEIRLTVVFEISTYYTLSSSIPGGGGKVEFYVDGAKAGRAIAGQTVTMKVVPASGWTFDSALYEAPGGGLDTLRANVKGGQVTKLSDTTYRFEMQKLPVSSGKVIFNNHNKYGISADVRGGHGSLAFQLVDKETYSTIAKGIENAEPGQLVEVLFKPDNKYWFNKDDVAHGADFLTNNSSQVEWQPPFPNRFIFKMPASNVKIVTAFVKDDTKQYYYLTADYNSSQGTAVARDQATGQPIVKALAGQTFKIEVTSKENYRVSGIKRTWSGGEQWLSFPPGKTVTVTGLVKQGTAETIHVYFEAYNEYTTVGGNQYSKDKATVPGDIKNGEIELVNVPQGGRIKVGDTIKFSTKVKRTGFNVSEVWLVRDGALVKMLSPTKEGGSDYQYKVTLEDKDKKIQFLAVRTGKEPVHYVLPEYTIGNTGIVNVGTDLYSVIVTANNKVIKDQPIGKVYGMGAQMAVNDADIKAKTNVKVKVVIPKTTHEYVGAGSILIYQVDTVSIRFNDYVLDNYKVLQDGAESFVYEFWYNELTDLNIMVNFKEIGTKEIKSTDTTKPISVNVGGQTVNLDKDGKGTIKVGSSESTVAVTVTP